MELLRPSDGDGFLCRHARATVPPVSGVGGEPGGEPAFPTFPISMWEALGRRLRRNYIWIFLILGVSWLSKVWLIQSPAGGVADFVQRAAVGPIPGKTMLILGLVFYSILIMMSLATVNMTHSSGEVLPRFGPDTIASMFSSEGWTKIAPDLCPHRRRKQLMALIITAKAEEVSKRIITDLHRGVDCAHRERHVHRPGPLGFDLCADGHGSSSP